MAQKKPSQKQIKKAKHTSFQYENLNSSKFKTIFFTFYYKNKINISLLYVYYYNAFLISFDIEDSGLNAEKENRYVIWLISLKYKYYQSHPDLQ